MTTVEQAVNTYEKLTNIICCIFSLIRRWKKNTYKNVYLFIYGCAGSSLLCAGVEWGAIAFSEKNEELLKCPLNRDGLV